MPGTVLRMYYLQFSQLRDGYWWGRGGYCTQSLRQSWDLDVGSLTQVQVPGLRCLNPGSEERRKLKLGIDDLFLQSFHCWSSTCCTDYRKLKILARKPMKKRGAGLNSSSPILLLILEPECQPSLLFFPETFFLNEKFFSDQMSF